MNGMFTYAQHSEYPSLVNFMFMWHPMNEEGQWDTGFTTWRTFRVNTKTKLPFFNFFFAFWHIITSSICSRASQEETDIFSNVKYWINLIRILIKEGGGPKPKAAYSREDFGPGRCATSVTQDWINLGIWLRSGWPACDTWEWPP